MKILLIAVFGLLGVFSRYWGALFVARYLPTQHFPLGTFIINIIGSFLIGVVYSLGVEKGVLSVDVRVGLLVGLLGGFTTFHHMHLKGLASWSNLNFSWAVFIFLAVRSWVVSLQPQGFFSLVICCGRFECVLVTIQSSLDAQTLTLTPTR